MSLPTIAELERKRDGALWEAIEAEKNMKQFDFSTYWHGVMNRALGRAEMYEKQIEFLKLGRANAED